MSVVVNQSRRNVGLTEALSTMEPGDSIWVEGGGHASAHACLAQQQKKGQWKNWSFSQEAYVAMKRDWSDKVELWRITRLK